jgi:ABC-type nitrate/sulfonate/bicarbonate transport system substrate-binding protein
VCVLRVAVPDLVSNSYFPLVAAVDLGFLRDEGIACELEVVYPVARAMASLRDRTIDVLAGAAHAVPTAFPEWRGAKLVAAVAKHTYWFLVVRADLGVKRGDVESVKGLRIGAAPGIDVCLVELLRDAGVDPQRDGVQIGPIPSVGGRTTSFGVSAARALENGEIDGFWANGMGAEVAVRRGAGTVVLDVRRGDGPPIARDYTFPAVIMREDTISGDRELAAAVVRGLVRTLGALRQDPDLASEVGRRRFPAEEAGLISALIARDAPYYDASIAEDAITSLSAFSCRIGLLGRLVAYQQVVATELARFW